MDLSKYKKLKRSGCFYRNVPKTKQSFKSVQVVNKQLIVQQTHQVISEQQIMTNSLILPTAGASEIPRQETKIDDYSSAAQHENNIESTYKENYQSAKDNEFRDELKIWSITHNITLNALKGLLRILQNTSLREYVPLDPRTLLETIENVEMSTIGNDQLYWHRGIEQSLRECLFNTNTSFNISLNVNIDGLPLFKRSSTHFWPILFNIHGKPQYKVQVIGIYCGKGKPPMEAFLRPFVNELQPLLNAGVIINEHKIGISVHAFICDSPARAFIKGTVNFNHESGCQKCITVGEQFVTGPKSRRTIFPRFDCELRTNESFRQKIDAEHHKNDTPLEDLPVDMINQFVVADELHLLHLGWCKRFLYGLTNTKINNKPSGYSIRWGSAEISIINTQLKSIQLPIEFGRSIRGLDELCNWKGTKYRSFLHYLGIVILKEHLPTEYYLHFLNIFCAVTICSSNEYSHLVHIAQYLFEQYVEMFIHLYGMQYINSNMHNLVHIVEDVRNIGILPSISAYPFENTLYSIKKLLRKGNAPLVPVGKRLSERSIVDKVVQQVDKYPILSKINDGETIQNLFADCNFFYRIQFENFILDAKQFQNKWFLTHKKEIVNVKNVIQSKSETFIYGSSLKKLEDFFEKPFKSSHLNIYCSDCIENDAVVYGLHAIKSKLVAIKTNENDNDVVFMPLMHTSF